MENTWKPVVGFSTPSGAYGRRELDVHELVVKQPASTYFIRAGKTYQDLNIEKGDLLVIDRSLIPKPKHITLIIINQNWHLVRWDPYRFNKEGLEIWGVGTYIIRNILA
jgi:DNA polymerase V